MSGLQSSLVQIFPPSNHSNCPMADYPIHDKTTCRCPLGIQAIQNHPHQQFLSSQSTDAFQADHVVSFSWEARPVLPFSRGSDFLFLLILIRTILLLLGNFHLHISAKIHVKFSVHQKRFCHRKCALYLQILNSVIQFFF